jgi:hypothetical protein
MKQQTLDGGFAGWADIRWSGKKRDYGLQEEYKTLNLYFRGW